MAMGLLYAACRHQYSTYSQLHTCDLILSCSYQWRAYGSYCLLILKADAVLLEWSFLHEYIKYWLFPLDQWPLPPYITFDNLSFNLWWLWFSYSGPWIWCGLHSFFAFCRSVTRRRKPVRRSTTRVKALSMGSKLQLAVGRWMKIVA
jgi:hypothetical protein